MSGSNPETTHRPPWISFLFEPVYTALEQATARVRDLEGEIRRLDPEALRRFQEGVKPENQRKLATKKRGPETLIPVARPSAQESASETIASSDRTQPSNLLEREAWDRVKEREVADLEAKIQERAGAEVVDRLMAGEPVAEILRDLKLEADHGLEAWMERLAGFLGLEGEG